MNALVKGFGGGKDGGGGVRTPTESPNTARSKQVARMMMLLSEGEIGGLVNGFQSIYFDGTPVQNADGTYNFDGVEIDFRHGTANQTYMPGFEYSESEKAVSVEVRKDTPIVRTINNPDVDAVRVTMSFPQLTYQSTETGDLGGTEVQFKVAIQNDGGGFVEQNIRNIFSRNLFTSNGQMTVASSLIVIDIAWVGEIKYTSNGFSNDVLNTWWQYSNYRLEQRLVGDTNWTAIKTYNFSGRAKRIHGNGFSTNTHEDFAPETRVSEQLELNHGMYEFRLVHLSEQTGCVIEGAAISIPDATAVVNEKFVSRYQRAYEFNLQGSGPWDIRVERITPDSTESNLQNQTFWGSYTEIIDEKFTYPLSAIGGVKIDAQQFSAIPKIGWRIRGLVVEVPSNYDPVQRTYSGVWDGTFKRAWTNNPVWHFRDIITSNRYGLGDLIPADATDKWQLFKIAVHCDELVSDGQGGQEPRFTSFLYLQTQEEAFKVLASMASVFASIAYWGAGSIQLSQDAPADVVQGFTHANVNDGLFTYSTPSSKVRHTVALVTYVDTDLGISAVEYVEDREGIAKYGYVETAVQAIGCGSRSQAHRFGMRLLYSERMQADLVTSSSGFDGVYLFPGAVVEVANKYRMGVEGGGRVLSSTATTVTLDRDVVLGVSPKLTCTLPDGDFEKVAITGGSGATVNAVFSVQPDKHAIWLLSGDIVPAKFRVVSIKESEGVIEFSALEYSDLKYTSIENDLFLQDTNTAVVGVTPPAKPTGQEIKESLFLAGPGIVNNRATLSWVGAADKYLLTWLDPSGQFNERQSSSASIDISPMPTGNYKFSIQGVNKLGRKSAIHRFNYYALGKSAPPADVENFRFNYVDGKAELSFDRASDLDVITGGYIEIRHSATSQSWHSAIKISEAPGGSTSLLTIAKTGNYLAKWFDSSGKESANVKIISTGLSFKPKENIVVTKILAFDALENMYISDALYLDGVLKIDAWEQNFDEIPLLSMMGGVALSGSAEDSTPVDLGAVLTSRLNANIESFFYNEDDLIDARADVDNWLSVDATLVSGASVALYVATTNDDPNAAPFWSDWELFNVGTYTARGYKFKYLVASNGRVNVRTESVSVEIDVPDKDNKANDVVSAAATKVITYSDPFWKIPVVEVTPQDMETGDYFRITNSTKEGFEITFRNSSGVLISRTFDYLARGY